MGEEESEKTISSAVMFHGHLGPFLVIGVRMGNIAKRILNAGGKGNIKFHATLKVPLATPFSCTIDGIQATTSCTIGNQKLKVENSLKELIACFEMADSDKSLRISVNPKLVEELSEKMKKGAGAEELATQIAAMPEKELFTIETYNVFDYRVSK